MAEHKLDKYGVDQANRVICMIPQHLYTTGDFILDSIVCTDDKGDSYDMKLSMKMGTSESSVFFTNPELAILYVSEKIENILKLLDVDSTRMSPLVKDLDRDYKMLELDFNIKQELKS